jgi:hypothetical protein
MNVSGFTFIRNAIKYDFPIIEVVTSALPIADEFVVNIGRSEDDTLKLICLIRLRRSGSQSRSGTTAFGPRSPKTWVQKIAKYR